MREMKWGYWNCVVANISNTQGQWWSQLLGDGEVHKAGDVPKVKKEKSISNWNKEVISSSEESNFLVKAMEKSRLKSAEGIVCKIISVVVKDYFPQALFSPGNTKIRRRGGLFVVCLLPTVALSDSFRIQTKEPGFAFSHAVTFAFLPPAPWPFLDVTMLQEPGNSKGHRCPEQLQAPAR